MRLVKAQNYFPAITAIHFLMWGIDLYFYQGTKALTPARVAGEAFSSWVMIAFAANFLMATRARWVERIFGGLDKMYVVHRRAGMAAVVLLLLHFFVVPKGDAVAAGKLLGMLGMVLIFLGVIISAVPFFKRVLPYHIWVNLHKLMGLFYLFGMAHATLMDSLIKELPLTRSYVIVMALVGISAWFYRAVLWRFFVKPYPYCISRLEKKHGEITDVYLTATSGAMPFQAGQFAFFTFPELSRREAHPFTISSHPSDPDVRISVKKLGDYTKKLNEGLSVGSLAAVEGPYGCFTQDHISEKEQVWIAGGIGITPFLSLIKGASTHSDLSITLYWSIRTQEDAVFSEELLAASEKASNVKLILWKSDTDGRLSIEKMNFSNLNRTGFLICGPAPLKQAMISQLKKLKVGERQIYEEAFSFR